MRKFRGRNKKVASLNLGSAVLMTIGNKAPSAKFKAVFPALTLGLRKQRFLFFDEQFLTLFKDSFSDAHHIRNACFWNISACYSASSMFSQKQFISNTSSYKADFMLFKIIQYFWHHLRFILKYIDLSNGGIIAYNQ